MQFTPFLPRQLCNGLQITAGHEKPLAKQALVSIQDQTPLSALIEDWLEIGRA